MTIDIPVLNIIRNVKKFFFERTYITCAIFWHCRYFWAWTINDCAHDNLRHRYWSAPDDLSFCMQKFCHNEALNPDYVHVSKCCPYGFYLNCEWPLLKMFQVNLRGRRCRCKLLVACYFIDSIASQLGKRNYGMTMIFTKTISKSTRKSRNFCSNQVAFAIASFCMFVRFSALAKLMSVCVHFCTQAVCIGQNSFCLCLCLCARARVYMCAYVGLWFRCCGRVTIVSP